VVEVIIGLKLGSWILGLLGPINSVLGRLLLINPALSAFLLAAGVIGGTFVADQAKKKSMEERANELGFEKQGGSLWNPFDKIPTWRNKQTGEVITEGQMRTRIGADPYSGNLPSADKEKMAKESYDFWIGKGYSPSAAAGMVAQEDKESGFRPGAVGDSGAAHGSFQWHDDRRRAILAGTGIDVADASTSHQKMLEAAHWEQTQGGEQRAGGLIRGASSAAEAGSFGSRFFERPGNADAEAADRAARAEFWAKRFGGPDRSLLAGSKPATVNGASSSTTNNTHSVDTNINGPIQIHTAATDADGIAKGIGQSLRKYAVVGQINYGLA